MYIHVYIKRERKRESESGRCTFYSVDEWYESDECRADAIIKQVCALHRCLCTLYRYF